MAPVRCLIGPAAACCSGASKRPDQIQTQAKLAMIAQSYGISAIFGPGPEFNPNLNLTFCTNQLPNQFMVRHYSAALKCSEATGIRSVSAAWPERQRKRVSKTFVFSIYRRSKRHGRCGCDRPMPAFLLIEQCREDCGAVKPRPAQPIQ